MSKRMLIDSSHPEETRVVVLDGQKVEEFDFEAASKRPLKGNIYLAKVTRVEPSLQAAFVEYGGNRQGFLAFSEIHPDYYQIPVADRIALIAEAEAEARRRQEDDVESFEIASGPKLQPASDDDSEDVEDETGDAGDDVESSVVGAGTAGFGGSDPGQESETDSEPGSQALDAEIEDSEEIFTNHPERVEEPPDPNFAISEPPHDIRDEEDEEDAEPPEHVEQPEPAENPEDADIAAIEIAQGIVDEQAAAGEAALDPQEEGPPDVPVPGGIPDLQAASAAEPAQALQASRPPQRWMRRRHYKIQEVIKRRQIILVQVVKEERGNKGAALTTYLSLAGRYCVLMPNTPRGGGISRKITDAEDRKRLKSAAQALELPEGMGLIIRTAGENRSKVEIRRDYEYLLRLWDTIRELTLKSNAPACVYEEGDLIKRAIRDLYNKDVADVLVEGEDGYRNAKEFMRMLMPSHAKNVKLYKEPVPLFQRHQIEAQLDAMFQPTVVLRSGGYIVINQTEALVSIDVNSGRATREHSIEETAHKTNLEAADEIGRQLRLRDLAGLIVIDFIDMEDARNDRDVEKRLRDAVKTDRARVQIGRISQFGLLEMSRQRLRAGVIAGSTVPCPHCGGQGIVRSVESTALRVLRALEEEGQRLKASAVTVRVAGDVAIYALNQKRKELARIESDYGMEIAFDPKDSLPAGSFELDRTAQKTAEERARYAVSVEAGFAVPVQETEPASDEEALDAESELEQDIEDQELLASTEQGRERTQPQSEAGGRRRRRRRRGGRDRAFPDRLREVSSEPLPGAASPDHPIVSALANADPDAAGISSGSMQSQQRQTPPTGEGSGRRRRRRRRRGRRGQGNGDPFAPRDHGQPVAPPAQVGEWQDRLGTVDEIDTTPRPDERNIAAPNASSTPEWSFGDSRAHETPRNEEAVSGTQSSGPRQVDKPASPGEPAPPANESASEEPPKKGWWQRAFRPDS